ncbi:hypothetical protein CHS0354_023191 [Potamilus streckersoni]|uniref:Uncharacterized protein n=1 Tax=Potamilus streckersoni TaxID=2493646 RepID=A0AAE0SJP4_9BIVA|nr:hypothetical protein CHS0354_023191 [Potamilus streckersoni]
MNTKVVSTPVLKRTQKDGTARRNPIPIWKREGKNLRKRVIRLSKRIIRLAGQKSAPMIAFLYVLDGKVHACGSDHLCRLMCQAISLNDIIPQAGTEEKTKGQRERTTYSEANRPSYWPEGIPFCSHSKRQDNGAGRVMTSSMMTSVLDSFKKHCLKKIYAGFTPINIASTNSMDQLKTLSRELSLSLLGDHEYAKPIPKQELINPDVNLKSNPEVCCHLYDSFQNKDHQIAIDALREMKYCTHHLEQVLSDVPDSMFHMQFMPDCTKTNRRFSTLPDDLIACGPGLPLWEIFYHFPNIVAIRCFAHAIIHLDHYVKQFHYLGETAESLAERFGSVPKEDASLEDVLVEQAKAVLYTPSNPGPGILLFFAGMLGREVHVHKEDFVISSSPCPCTCQHEEEVHVYMDNDDRVYFLLKKELIQEELPTQRKRQKREISSDLTVSSFVAEHAHVLQRSSFTS